MTIDEKPARATVLTREDAMQILRVRNHLALGRVEFAAAMLEMFADPAMTKIDPWGWIEAIAGGTAADFAPPAPAASALGDFTEPSELDIEQQLDDAQARIDAACNPLGRFHIGVPTPHTQAVEAAEREKFEAWMIAEGHQLAGAYWSESQERMFLAWQARAALTRQQEVAVEVTFSNEQLADMVPDGFVVTETDGERRPAMTLPQLRQFVANVRAASRSPAQGVAGGVDASWDVKLHVRHSEWQTLSPEAQEKLMDIGRRAVKNTREQRLRDATARSNFPAVPLAATQAQPSPNPAVGGSGGVPVAKLRVYMDKHDMGQSLAPNPPYKVAIAHATTAADSLPLGNYDLYLPTPNGRADVGEGG